MTPHQPTRDERDAGSGVPEGPRATLPFEYEDRSDGRHARLMKEVMAAMAWSRSQREQGFLPS